VSGAGGDGTTGGGRGVGAAGAVADAAGVVGAPMDTGGSGGVVRGRMDATGSGAWAGFPDSGAYAAGEICCAPRMEMTALPGIPLVGAGDDLVAIVAEGLRRAERRLRDGDVLVVASKLVSRAEGRFVDLATVEPSARARELGAQVGADERLVELILRESVAVSRLARGAVIVRHRLGFVTANAGIDLSNARPPGLSGSADGGGAAAAVGPWAMLLPLDPDGSAERLRRGLAERTGVSGIGIVVSDSFGRPFRLGTVGAAIGVAGMPALWDQRGRPDLHGRQLEHTVTALADQVAAAADLIAGQANEGRAVVHVRGLRFPAGPTSARDLLRPPGEDLYA
jgi:coenzyme F420-0:L-glutamate ligase / coenzyme F420-1:gamma-L-glutamate ligase